MVGGKQTASVALEALGAPSLMDEVPITDRTADSGLSLVDTGTLKTSYTYFCYESRLRNKNSLPYTGINQFRYRFITRYWLLRLKFLMHYHPIVVVLI